MASSHRGVRVPGRHRTHEKRAIGYGFRAALDAADSGHRVGQGTGGLAGQLLAGPGQTGRSREMIALSCRALRHSYISTTPA